MGPSLLESLAALAATALLMVALSAALLVNQALGREATRTAENILRRRQVEHLLDVALARGGPTGGAPARVAEATDDTLVVHADRDGDGTINVRSSEVTTLTLRHASGRARLLHGLGLQSMTVLDGLAADSSFGYLDSAGGRAADISSIACVRLHVVDEGDGASLELLASVEPRSQ